MKIEILSSAMSDLMGGGRQWGSGTGRKKRVIL